MSVLDDLVQQYGLERLNTVTKYPSIITYHSLGQRGGVIDELNQSEKEPIPDGQTLIKATEKIDGTNSRIVIIGEDFFMGSRNEFVHARGDRIVTNPAITPLYMGLTNFLEEYVPTEDRMIVIYGEAYGRDISNAKCYTTKKTPGFRLFDGWSISLSELTDLFDNTDEQRLFEWRDNLNQPWWSDNTFTNLCAKFNLQRVPQVWEGKLEDIPSKVEETAEWLQQFKMSQAILDDEQPDVNAANSKYGRAEGIVIRSADRKYIRKLRFENYRKGQLNNWQ